MTGIALVSWGNWSGASLVGIQQDPGVWQNPWHAPTNDAARICNRSACQEGQNLHGSADLVIRGVPQHCLEHAGQHTHFQAACLVLLAPHVTQHTRCAEPAARGTADTPTAEGLPTASRQICPSWTPLQHWTPVTGGSMDPRGGLTGWSAQPVAS